MTISTPPSRRSTTRLTQAWQGLRFAVPTDWSPVKIEGDFDRGFFAMADLDRERLGVRWQTVGKKADPQGIVDAAMRAEVGQLAFDELTAVAGSDWTAARLYVEPEPPGRDVWVGYSSRTRRVVQMVYQTKRRDGVLASEIVPSLADEGELGGTAKCWAVFWLNVVLPRAMKLSTQRLNVGDLALTFDTDNGRLVVRQIAAATVSLGRRTLESWALSLREPKHYRPIGKPEPVTVGALTGLRQRHVRRRRWFFMRWLPADFVAYALHDVVADRLTLVRAPDDATAIRAIEGIDVRGAG